MENLQIKNKYETPEEALLDALDFDSRPATPEKLADSSDDRQPNGARDLFALARGLTHLAASVPPPSPKLLAGILSWQAPTAGSFWQKVKSVWRTPAIATATVLAITIFFVIPSPAPIKRSEAVSNSIYQDTIAETATANDVPPAEMVLAGQSGYLQ